MIYRSQLMTLFNLWPEFQSRTYDLQPKDHPHRPWFRRFYQMGIPVKEVDIDFPGLDWGIVWALLFFLSPLPSLWGISCLPAWYFGQITWCQQGIQGYVSIVEICFACVHLWFHVCIYVMFCYITLDYIKLQYVMSWCFVLMLCLVMSCYAIYM